MECAYPAVAAAIATTAAHAESAAADAATTTTSTTAAAATTSTTTTAETTTTTAPIRPPSTVSTTEAAAGEAVISDCLAGREQGQPELDSGGSAVAAAAAVAGGAGGDGAAVGDGGTPSLTTAITVTEQGQPELDSGGSAAAAAAAVVIAANDTANDSGADPATVVVVVDGNGGGGGGVNLGTDIAEGGEDDGINNNNNNNSRSCVVDNNNDDETTTATDTSCAVGIGVRAHRTTSPPGRTAAASRISSETSTDTISASSVASPTPTAAASCVSDLGVVSSAIGSPLSTSLACVPSESCYSSSTTTCVTFATTSTTATTDTAVAATISLTKAEEREDSISGGSSNNNNNNNNEDNDEVVADGEQIEVDIVTERQDVAALVKEHHDLVTRPTNDGHDVFDNDDDDNGPTIPKMARLVVMAGPQPPTSNSLPPRSASASSPTAPLTSSSSSPPRRSPSVPPPTTTSVEEVEEVHLELATVVDPETTTTTSTATVEGVLVGDGGVGGDADACAADDDNDHHVGEPEAEVLLIEAIPSDSSAVVAGELIASLTTPQPDDVHTSMETDVTAEPADMHATTTTAETTTTTTEETTTAAITTTIAATTTSTPTTTLTAAPPTAEAVAKTIANETIATTTLVSPTSSSTTIAPTTATTMITTPLATVPAEAAFDAVIPITAPPESIIVETSALATATTTTAAAAPTTITTNTPMTTTSAATATTTTTTREAEETAAAGTTTIISCPAAAATTTTSATTKITMPLAVSVPKTAAAAATATLSSTSLPAVPPSVQAAQPAPAEVLMQPAMATTNIIITSTAAPSIVTTAPMPVDQPPAIRRRNADPPVLQQGHQLQYTRTTPNNTNNIITKNIIFTPTMITGCSSSSTSSSGRGGGGGGGTNTSYSTMTLPGTITTSNRSGFSNNVISTPTIVVQVPHDRNHNNTTRTTTTTTSAAAATTTAATTTAGGMRRTDATDHNDTKVLFDGSEIATEVAPQGGTGGPATGAVAPPVGVSLMDDDWLEEGDGSWPPVWTREMWLERRAKHHWLSAREGRLGCRYCLRVKYMGTTADAIVVSSEWVSYSITYSGDTREQQLKSLRNKLQRHEVSKAHFKAEEIINNFKKNPPVNGEATHMVNKSVQLTTQVFADIYTMVKDSIDFEAYQAAFGTSLSDKVYREFALQQEFDVVTIVEHMAEQMKATLVRHVMSQRFPLAVVVDHIEGYLASAESVFLIYLRVQSPSGGLQNVFWDAIPYPWPDDPEMDPMPVVSQSLLDGGFTVEFLSQNLMCFVTDPLGTHLGAGSGSCDQLAQSFDRIVIWYVLAYRLEEMVLSVLRAIEAPNYVGQLYETLYSLMEISERNAQELLINTPAVHEQVSRVGALLHPADVASTFKSVAAIIESYPILYLYMVQAGNDITRTEAEKRKYSFAKGLLESEQFVRELALVYDVLKLLHDTRVQIDHPDCDMPRADSVLVQAMEGLMALQQQPGPFETAALRELQPGASRVFLSVGPLVNNPLLCPPNRVTFMEHIVALSRDNMISISGLEEELVNNFIRDLHTIKLTNWPVNSPVTSADESVERLCSVFQIEDRKPVILNAFRQLIYTGGPPAGEQLSADVVFMQNHANIFPCSSELCAYVVEKINKCKPATSVDGVRRLAASLFVHINGSEQLATLPIVRAWYLKHPLSVELKSPKKARLEDEHWVAYSSIADEIADHQRTDEQGFVAVVHQ